MVKAKMTGFLTALILAVVSFFVIFFLFPEAADKCFGVSMKNGAPEIQKVESEFANKAADVVKDVANQVAEKTTQAVSNTVSDTVKNLISKKDTNN